jgi:hypothetical protein
VRTSKRVVGASLIGGVRSEPSFRIDDHSRQNLKDLNR